MRKRGYFLGPRPDDPDIPPALKHAHELMQFGNYSEAAPVFEQLASSAERRGGPRAPFLFIQAARARLNLDQNAVGVGHLRHGLELFATSRRFTQLYRAGNRAISELKALGLEKEAREIATFVQNNIPAIAESPTQRIPDRTKLTLPTHCPSCGGPVHSNEVEWIDSRFVECSFCGSPIRAE